MEIETAIHYSVTIMLFFDTLKLAKTSPPCNWNQITRVHGNSTHCWDCSNCPVGYGLTPQCSSYVTTDVPIRCEKCKKGVTYSSGNDISSCKPCSICGPNEYTIRHCNATHNAICGKCKPGFYREITYDCWPCTTCCPDSTNDEIEQECLKQGLPAKQSCRLNFRTEGCAKKAKTTVKPKLSIAKSSAESFPFDPTKARTIVINRTVIVVGRAYPSGLYNSPDRLWMGIGIGTVAILVSIAATYFLCKLRKRFKARTHSLTTFKSGFVHLNTFEAGTEV